MNQLVMRYCLFLLLLISCSCSFYSCKNETDASDVQVIVSPDSLVLHADNEDIISFKINLLALKEPLTELQITQTTTKTGTSILLDTAISFQKFYMVYNYNVPGSIYEKNIKLSFIAKTASDYSRSDKNIVLDSVHTELNESSSHVMYSASLNANNAFSLTRRQVMNYPSDSAFSDIYDYHDSQSNASLLTCEWRSATGMFFSRFNDYNYAEATARSLQDCYSNASKNSRISSLKDNDIIMVGHSTKALGVIKIIAIFDSEDDSKDRYVFNLKYIE
jgi:hypothetical protein